MRRSQHEVGGDERPGAIAIASEFEPPDPLPAENVLPERERPQSVTVPRHRKHAERKGERRDPHGRTNLADPPAEPEARITGSGCGAA